MPKILIVDDDPLIRNLLGQILEVFEDKGVQLLNADNGVSMLKPSRKKDLRLSFLMS
jgi:CheY-like chemotaxis protein